MKYITFTLDMARAYAEGRKRMTRRVIKWPKWIQAELSDERSINKIVKIINSNNYSGVVKRGCCGRGYSWDSNPWVWCIGW